jgi:hypothetical protein
MAAVPEQLLKDLHDADERFTELRRRLDSTDELDLDHRQKLADELREAERLTEEIRKRIAEAFSQD